MSFASAFERAWSTMSTSGRSPREDGGFEDDDPQSRSFPVLRCELSVDERGIRIFCLAGNSKPAIGNHSFSEVPGQQYARGAIEARAATVCNNSCIHP